MLRRAAIVFSSTALTACTFSAPDDAYSVEEVVNDISSSESRLHGKTVLVSGWLGECGGLDCGLYPTLLDARTVAANDHESDAWRAAMERRLAVGGDSDFDMLAMPMQFNEVVIEGEINASLRKPPNDTGTQFGCWGRCPDIAPHSIKMIVF